MLQQKHDGLVNGRVFNQVIVIKDKDDLAGCTREHVN
jgi:hypothetical protein